MKLTEKILAALCLLALVLKFMLLPGGSVLFVVAIQLLACIYFVLGFALFNGIRLRNIFKRESYAGISAMRITAAVAMGLALSVACVGITFKVMMWPGAGIMLLEGVFTIVILLSIMIVKYVRGKSRFYRDALIRCGIIGAVTLALYITPSSSLVKWQYRNYPGYIHAYEQYSLDPGNDSLADNLELERMRIILSPGEFTDYKTYYYNSRRRQGSTEE